MGLFFLDGGEQGKWDEKLGYSQIENVLIVILKNLDFVLYLEKDFCWKMILGMYFRKIMVILLILEGGRER